MGRFFQYFALALFGFSLGVLRVFLAQHHVTPADIDYYNSRKLEVVGVITEVDIRRDKAKYTVSAESMDPGGNDEMAEVKGEILISMGRFPKYQYGDRVRLYGELQAPGEFDGFDYGAYLSRFGVYSVMYQPSIKVVESGQGSMFWHVMSFLQNKFMEHINRLFPEPHASFEAGLLIGARKGIPDSLMQKFNITGLTHIIAISGFNITIIIAFVMWMLGRLPRMTGFWVAIGAIVLFTLFVGASPAVVRASIMGILGLIALNYGRQNNIHLTILWSAAIMVLWNPRILIYDVGFQLSFAAVLGLMYVSPRFKKYSEKLPQAFGIREAITMTLSAQVMALPIIVYNFERLSLIAPLSNLLVAFAIPPAMLFGFMAVLVSFIFFPLAQVLAYLTWGILSYIIKVIELTAVIPYASVNLPGMTFLMMAGYYLLLILLLMKFSKSKI